MSFPVDNPAINCPLDYPHLRQPHTTRHPSHDPTTPWHQSSRPSIVVQGERVQTEDRRVECECRFMASVVEEHLPVPNRTVRVANDACPKDLHTKRNGYVFLSVRVTTSRSNH